MSCLYHRETPLNLCEPRTAEPVPPTWYGVALTRRLKGLPHAPAPSKAEQERERDHMDCISEPMLSVSPPSNHLGSSAAPSLRGELPSFGAKGSSKWGEVLMLADGMGDETSTVCERSEGGALATQRGRRQPSQHTQREGTSIAELSERSVGRGRGRSRRPRSSGGEIAKALFLNHCCCLFSLGLRVSGWSNGAQSWCSGGQQDPCECTGGNTKGTAASPTRPKRRWAIALQLAMWMHHCLGWSASGEL